MNTLPLPAPTTLISDAVPSARIVVAQGGRHITILHEQIAYLEGRSNYTYLHTKEGKCYVMSKTLKTYEEILDTTHFVRVHKSAIVNINCLTEVGSNEERCIKLHSGQVLPVARRRVKELERALPSWGGGHL